MLETIDSTTVLCLFHNDASAYAAVHDLLALGVDESDLAVVGDADTELNGKFPTDELASLLAPDSDLARMAQDLHHEGTIVAIHITEPLTEQVDEIFRRNIATDELKPGHFHRDPNLTFDEPNRLDIAEDVIESEKTA